MAYPQKLLIKTNISVDKPVDCKYICSPVHAISAHPSTLFKLTWHAISAHLTRYICSPIMAQSLMWRITDASEKVLNGRCTGAIAAQLPFRFFKFEFINLNL